MNNFTHSSLTKENLDNFYIRKSILNAVEESMPYFRGRLLDVGCGKMPYRELIYEKSAIEEYIGIDIENALEYDAHIKPDSVWDGKQIPFPDHSFNTLLATEVLEHCPDPNSILCEMYRVLKSEGVIFFTVPFLWPTHESPHDEYRYTPFALTRMLKEAGFVDIEIFIGGGWHASLAQMIGLWVRRAPLRQDIRSVASFLLKPVVKYLLALDARTGSSIADQQMYTNLYGRAKK